MAGFFTVDPQEQLLSPDTIERRRKLLDAMAAESRKMKPIQHWTQGAAMLANALGDRFEETRLNAAEKKNNEADAATIAMLLGGLGGGTAPAAPSAAGVSPAASPPAAPGAPPAVAPAAVIAGQNQLAEKFGPHFSNAAFKDIAGKVLEPKLAGGAATRPDSISGMNPDLVVNLARAVNDAPGNVQINSGYRSPELQAKLFRDATMKYGSADAARKWVAPPGASNHNRGLAADLGMDPAAKAFMHANAGQYGLRFPMAHEPWHIEATAGRAPQAIAAAMGGRSAPSAPSAPTAAPSAPVAAPAASGMNGALVAKALQSKSPAVRAVAQAMLMKAVTGNKVTYQTTPDGTILALDPTGRTPPRPVYQAPVKPMALGEGQTLVDPSTGKVIAGGDAKAPTVQKLKLPDQSEKAVQWDKKTRKWVPLEAPGGGTGFSPKLTETQSKDVGFYTRGLDANRQLQKYESELLSGTENLKGAVPLVGNSLTSEKFQRASRAAKDVLAVILRKDTGAAITNQEFEDYGKIFIPRYGDSKGVIADKARARALALDAIKRGLGSVSDVVKYATEGRFTVDSNGVVIDGGTPAPATPAATPKWRIVP